MPSDTPTAVDAVTDGKMYVILALLVNFRELLRLALLLASAAVVAWLPVLLPVCLGGLAHARSLFGSLFTNIEHSVFNYKYKHEIT